FYRGPGRYANPWFHYKFIQNLAQLPAGTPYTTLRFNQTPSNGLPGGQSFQIDFANTDRTALVVIDVNGFLGGFAQPVATSDNYVALSATIGEHELGHSVGLRHQDAFGPPGFGIHNPPGPNSYVPAFPGLAGALET